jgi:predicted AlkP superfamily phosphohydrolase/phosphomutase
MASGLSSSLRAALHAGLPRRLVGTWLRRKYPPSSPAFLLPGSEFMAMLRVNLQGREPAGTVAPQDYEQTIEDLRNDIMALRNPDTGRPAAAEVVFAQRRYPGPLAAQLPDVVVRWANDAPILRLECPKYGIMEGGLRFVDKTHSSHTGRGAAFIAGPGVGHSTAPRSVDLRDLTATVFALCGVAPPEHLEGRPIELSGPPAGTQALTNRSDKP